MCLFKWINEANNARWGYILKLSVEFFKWNHLFNIIRVDDIKKPRRSRKYYKNGQRTVWLCLPSGFIPSFVAAAFDRFVHSEIVLICSLVFLTFNFQSKHVVDCVHHVVFGKKRLLSSYNNFSIFYDFLLFWVWSLFLFLWKALPEFGHRFNSLI